MSDSGCDGNAVEYFVDRHDRAGRRDSGIPRSLAIADLWRPGGSHAPLRRRAARRRRGARAARRPAAARHGGFPDRVLGRDPRRRRAGADQHAADPRGGRLHPGRQPRRCAGDLRTAGRAAAAGAAQHRGPAPDHRGAARRRHARTDRRSHARSGSPNSLPAAIRRRRPRSRRRTRWRSGCIPRAPPARRRACGTSMAACARRPTPMARRCCRSAPTT